MYIVTVRSMRRIFEGPSKSSAMLMLENNEIWYMSKRRGVRGIIGMLTNSDGKCLATSTIEYSEAAGGPVVTQWVSEDETL